MRLEIDADRVGGRKLEFGRQWSDQSDSRRIPDLGYLSAADGGGLRALRELAHRHRSVWVRAQPRLDCLVDAERVQHFHEMDSRRRPLGVWNVDRRRGAQQLA